MQSPDQKNRAAITNWWREPSVSVGGAMAGACNGLSTVQMGVQTRNFRAALMYGGAGYLASGRFSPKVQPPAGPLGATGTTSRSGPRRNLIYSGVSTVVSRVSTGDIPRVQFLTSYGDYALQQKAQTLNQYCDGIIGITDTRNEAIRALRDCCVFGTGIVKVYPDADNNMRVERVFPNELWVEMWDGREQRPQMLLQIGTCDKDVLAQRFPKFKNRILNLRPMPANGIVMAEFNSNQVPYYEGWHLPSSASAGDGRHVISLGEDLALCDEEWLRDSFPFAVIRYDDSLVGYWGMGVAEIGQGHQAALNDVLRAEFWAHSQMSLPRIWVDVANKLNRNHVASSRSGLIMEGQNGPPIVLNWDATTNNLVQYKQWIINDFFEMLGVSSTAAAGRKAAGVVSGEAIRESEDLQTDRLSTLAGAWDKFNVDIVKQIILCGEEIYRREGAFDVSIVGKNFVRKMDWGELRIEDEQYYLQPFTSSMLPRSPAARLQKLQELYQASLITKDTFMRESRVKDEDDMVSLYAAAQDNAKRTAYRLLVEGKYDPPDPVVQNIALCNTVLTQEILKAMDNGGDEKNIDLAHRWLAQSQEEMQRATQAVQPPAAPAAPAAPMPQPKSDLVPNQPAGPA